MHPLCLVELSSSAFAPEWRSTRTRLGTGCRHREPSFENGVSQYLSASATNSPWHLQALKSRESAGRATIGFYPPTHLGCVARQLCRILAFSSEDSVWCARARVVEGSCPALPTIWASSSSSVDGPGTYIFPGSDSTRTGGVVAGAFPSRISRTDGTPLPGS